MRVNILRLIHGPWLRLRNICDKDVLLGDNNRDKISFPFIPTPTNSMSTIHRLYPTLESIKDDVPIGPTERSYLL